jgi:hypothetical protein
VAHKKRESHGYVTSLSLEWDQLGRLIYERKRVDVNNLKTVLTDHYPEWEQLQKTIDTIRWVDDILSELTIKLSERAEDESIRIQERDVRPESEIGDNKDIPKSKGS